MTDANNRDTKDKVISELIESGRFYFNPDQFKLIFRYTTYVLVTVQDCLQKYKNNFLEILDEALKYNGDMRDNIIFSMMDDIQPKNKGKLFQTLGLYLYLADEVSRVPNPDRKTFLQAGREVYDEMASQKKGIAFTLQEKKDWFKEALVRLNLDRFDHIKQLQSDWLEKGLFKIENEINHQQNWNEGREILGTYVKLAEQLCEPKEPFAQIRNCISRALGAKELYTGKSIKEALEITKEHLDSALGKTNNLKKLNVPFVSKLNFIPGSKSDFFKDINKFYIKKGNEIRREDLTNKIYNQFPSPNKDISGDGKDFYRKILSYFPLSALNIINLEKYRFAFTESNNLRDIYPFNNPPGLTAKDCEDSRAAMGVRLSRFKLALFAKGSRKMNIEATAQTALHETLHIAFNAENIVNDPNIYGVKINGIVESEGRILSLYKEAEHLYSNLSQDAKTQLSKIISTSLEDCSLEKILNSAKSAGYSTSAGFYNNYSAGYTTGEEICANIFGLIHTEFAKDKNIDNNPFYSDDINFKPISDLAKKINDTMEIINQHLQQKVDIEKVAQKSANILSK